MDAVLDLVPDLGPDLAGGLTQRSRMTRMMDQSDSKAFTAAETSLLNVAQGKPTSVQDQSWVSLATPGPVFAASRAIFSQHLQINPASSFFSRHSFGNRGGRCKL